MLKTLNTIGDFGGLETGIFKLKAGASEAEMLQAAHTMDEAFLSEEDGYLGHCVLRGKDGLYLDIGFATTQEKAEQICAKWTQNEFALKYLEFIDPDSVELGFWQRLK